MAPKMVNNKPCWSWKKQIPFLEESYRTYLRPHSSKPSLLGAVKEANPPNSLRQNFEQQWEEVPVPKYFKGPYRSVWDPDINKYHCDHVVPIKDTESEELQKVSKNKSTNSEESLTKSESRQTQSNESLHEVENVAFSKKPHIHLRKSKKQVLSMVEKLGQESRTPPEEIFRPPVVVIVKKKKHNRNVGINCEMESQKLLENYEKEENNKHHEFFLKCTKPMKIINSKSKKLSGIETSPNKENDEINNTEHTLLNKNDLHKSFTGNMYTPTQEDNCMECYLRSRRKFHDKPQTLNSKFRHNHKKIAPLVHIPSLYHSTKLNDINKYRYKSKTNLGTCKDRLGPGLFTGRVKRNSSLSHADNRGLGKINPDSKDGLIDATDTEQTSNEVTGYYKPPNMNMNTLYGSDLCNGGLSSSVEIIPKHSNKNRRKNGNQYCKPFKKASSYSEMNYASGKQTKKGLKSFSVEQVQQYTHPNRYIRKGCYLSNIRNKFQNSKHDKFGQSGKIKCHRSTLKISPENKLSPSYEGSSFSKECTKIFKSMFKKPTSRTTNVQYVLMQDKLFDSSAEIKDIDSVETLLNNSSGESMELANSTNPQSDKNKSNKTTRRHINEDIPSKSSFKKLPRKKDQRTTNMMTRNSKNKRKESQQPINIKSQSLCSHEDVETKSQTLGTKMFNSEKYNVANKMITRNQSKTFEQTPPTDGIVSTPLENQSGNLVPGSESRSSEGSDDSYILVTISDRQCSKKLSTTIPKRVTSAGGTMKLESLSPSSNDSTSYKVPKRRTTYKIIRYPDASDKFLSRRKSIYRRPKSRSFKSNKGISYICKPKRNKKVPPITVTTQTCTQSDLIKEQSTISTQTNQYDGTEMQNKIKCLKDKSRLEPRKSKNKYYGSMYSSRCDLIGSRGSTTSNKPKGRKRSRSKCQRNIVGDKYGFRRNISVEPWSGLKDGKSRDLNIYTQNKQKYGETHFNHEGPISRKRKRRKKSKPLINKSHRFHYPTCIRTNTETQTDSCCLLREPLVVNPVDEVNIPLIASLSFKSFDSYPTGVPLYSSSQTDLSGSFIRQNDSNKAPNALKQLNMESSSEENKRSLVPYQKRNVNWPQSESLLSMSTSQSALKLDKPHTYASLMAKDFPQASHCKSHYGYSTSNNVPITVSNSRNYSNQNKTYPRRDNSQSRRDYVQNTPYFSRRENSRTSKDARKSETINSRRKEREDGRPQWKF